jgi:mRNA interferase HigB
MRVLGKKVLSDFYLSHADAESALNTWMLEAEEASWKNINEVWMHYPNASLIPKKNVVFNIKGNKYRLHTIMDFKRGIVLIKRAGTHAEYNTWIFEKES